MAEQDRPCQLSSPRIILNLHISLIAYFQDFSRQFSSSDQAIPTKSKFYNVCQWKYIDYVYKENKQTLER